jgi:hypothetical protein
MKTVTLIFSIVLFLAVNSFGQNENYKELLANSESINEIFNTILNDHKLMMDFKKAMSENEHAMMMMQGNSQMVSKEGKVEMTKEHQLMDKSKMMDICKQDTALCNKVVKMMAEHPDMMQKCMQKMEMMNSESKSEKTEHNHQHKK